MEKNEFQKEEHKLKETIQRIEEKTYYVWELLEKKANNFKHGISSPGDDIAYRTGKSEQNTLKQAMDHPYFGRFDMISEEGEETFYIGKQGVRDKNEDIVIVDWRMPMASVYYNFTLGQPQQSYYVEDRFNRKTKLTVDVIQKREFTIKNRKLLKINQQVADISSKLNVTLTNQGETIAVSDDFLREILDNSETTGYLKEIIATIQHEQDKAIRQSIAKNVIIQGVAGSGKSSIALHRLSFLLFNNKHVKPEDVLILGPSKLFISSFKDLLPELNLEGIEQSTYQQLILKYLKPYINSNADYSFKNYFENVLFKNNSEDEKKRIEFKGSESLALIIDIFIEEIQKQYINKFQSLTILDERLSRDDLEKIYEGYSYLSYTQRNEKFIHHIEKHFNDIGDAKIKEINDQYDFIVDRYLKNGGLTIDMLQLVQKQVDHVRKHKINAIQNELKGKLTTWKKNMETGGPISIYKQILSYDILLSFKHEIGEDIPELFKNYTFNQLTYFDLPPLFYIYLNLYDIPQKYTHIVIDEGQDFSLMHYLGLQKITKTMTILGDIDQSIFMGYGQNNWDQLMDILFEDGQDMFLRLETSYRSTKEIIETANQVLKNHFGLFHQPITPINRSGQDVSFEEVKHGDDLLQKIVTTIKEWKPKYKRMAIIHKDEKKAIKLANYLKQEYKHDVHYVSPDFEVQEGSISVLSSYYSKGMEFDAVMLVNVNEDSFPDDELHARVLYVLLTRAQQEVKVFYQDSPSKLLNGAVKVEGKVISRFDDIL